MKAYFFLMLKRILRLCPAVLAVSLLTTAAVAAVGARFLSDQKEQAALQMKVGVVGDLESTYVSGALFALEHLDDSRVYVELLPMEEAEAKARTDSGELLGYLFIPDDFVAGILERRSVPLRFIVKGGPSGIGSLLLLEACQVAADLTEESQRGIYGMQISAREAGIFSQELWSKVDAISLRYADTILSRSGIGKVMPVATPNGVSLTQYVLCALLTLLALIWGVSCYGILRRRDLSLEKMLAASQGRALSRSLTEYAAFFLFSALFFFLLCLPLPLLAGEELNGFSLFLAFLPGLAALTAMEFAVYQLVPKGAGALLGLSAALIALGFVSGCFYPLWFFPPAVQALSLWLPTGAAMDLLRSTVAGQPSALSLLVCFVWLVLFLALALYARQRALRR